ncbi:hypothetical protein AAFC00_001187 [Neodothiora populina]|uniref:Cns1/TTC4 wheel domain-containing protein n=1 Tax=Neodothiora populina TaxID=2781224 RepID=A0ABR3PN26_9PEZI
MSSSRVEELPDDFDEKLDLNNPPEAAKGASLDSMLNAAGAAFPMKKASRQDHGTGPAMPPAMESVKQQSADEILAMMNKMPLFMTTLDETGEDGGENIALEAIKALAYEGTRAENAGNFREQGNELAKMKKWKDAREFYDKALAALKLPQKPQDAEEGAPDMELVELDQEEEARKEKEIEEACLTNRALCNLELKNYGSCNRDCAASLRLNPKNIKAYYRSSAACLALDKIPEALDSSTMGLSIDPTNAPLLSLKTRIEARQTHLAVLEAARRKREERLRRENATIAHALKARNIRTRNTDKIPDMEDAVISLEDPMNAASTLSVPAMLLYPLQHQTDLIKAFREDESVGQHLTYIFPLPWDVEHEYSPEGVECYVESISGGLVKVGKKMALLRVLASGKVEVVDGLLRIHVLPKNKAEKWIQDYKRIAPSTR